MSFVWKGSEYQGCHWNVTPLQEYSETERKVHLFMWKFMSNRQTLKNRELCTVLAVRGD